MCAYIQTQRYTNECVITVYIGPFNLIKKDEYYMTYERE